MESRKYLEESAVSLAFIDAWGPVSIFPWGWHLLACCEFFPSNRLQPGFFRIPQKVPKASLLLGLGMLRIVSPCRWAGIYTVYIYIVLQYYNIIYILIYYIHYILQYYIISAYCITYILLSILYIRIYNYDKQIPRIGTSSILCFAADSPRPGEQSHPRSFWCYCLHTQVEDHP